MACSVATLMAYPTISGILQQGLDASNEESSMRIMLKDFSISQILFQDFKTEDYCILSDQFYEFVKDNVFELKESLDGYYKEDVYWEKMLAVPVAQDPIDNIIVELYKGSKNASMVIVFVHGGPGVAYGATLIKEFAHVDATLLALQAPEWTDPQIVSMERYITLHKRTEFYVHCLGRYLGNNRSSPKVHLVGYSAGASIAREMADLLERGSDEIRKYNTSLTLVDPPGLYEQFEIGITALQPKELLLVLFLDYVVDFCRSNDSIANEVLKVLEDESYLRTITFKHIFDLVHDIIVKNVSSPEFLLQLLYIQSVMGMNLYYDGWSAGETARRLDSGTMFVVQEPIEDIFRSFLFLEQWSIGVRGLTVVKSPIFNIAHSDFFEYDENVVALANHLKFKHERM